MHPHERRAFKNQLRAIIADRNPGICLDTAERWVIKNVSDPAEFFRYLQSLIPEDSILYIEGQDIASGVAAFYELNRAIKGTAIVERDMIYPAPEIFHVQIGQGTCEGFIDLLNKHPWTNCFIHLKGYRDQQLLFTFHDAFESTEMLVSGEVAEERVHSFCEKVRATYRREPNDNKRIEDLEHLLEAMDSPHRFRMFWPWWKKALFFWKK